MKHFDFAIIGAGIFGVFTAIELCKRKYKVVLINADIIPDPLASSTDISKVIRMEYGSDLEYMEMTESSMEQWTIWNEILETKIYHKTGFLLLHSKPLDHPDQSFERESLINLTRKGYETQVFNQTDIEKLFPAFNAQKLKYAFFNPEGGYVESGKAVTLLSRWAKENGVKIYERQKIEKLHKSNNKISMISTKDRNFQAEHYIVCAGAYSHYILPELKPYFRSSGHPVFHFKPNNENKFETKCFPTFAADISNTGWYGFPFHHIEKVVKIANHGKGINVHPEYDKREIYENDYKNIETFLSTYLPGLQSSAITFTRRCLYSDTMDGHFWIDKHPEIKNLTIGTGGSGHGLKMGPVIGKMIMNCALDLKTEWSSRYLWRELDGSTYQVEEARNFK